MKKATSPWNAAKLAAMTVDDLLSAYRGKPDRCMCGCAGKYFYTEANRAAAGQDRGYLVDADEVNTLTAARILRKVQKATTKIEFGRRYIATVIGNTQYVLYPMTPAI